MDNYAITQAIIDRAIYNETVNILMEENYEDLHHLVHDDETEELFNTTYLAATFCFPGGDFCQWFVRKFFYLRKAVGSSLVFTQQITDKNEYAISQQVAQLCETKGYQFSEERKKQDICYTQVEKTKRGASTCTSIMRDLSSEGSRNTGD